MGEGDQFGSSPFGKVVTEKCFHHPRCGVSYQMVGGEIVVVLPRLMVNVGTPRFQPGQFTHEFFDVVLFAVVVVFVGGSFPRNLRNKQTFLADAFS